MDQAAASPSCPRCGAECPAGAAHCPACGFTLIDGGERRPSGGAERPPSGGGSGLPWVVALAAAVAAVAAVFVMLFAGGGEGFPAAGPARTGPPAAVPALEAERRLELRFGGQSDDETAAVRCPYRIEPRQMVRCELRYADGIARAMLVRLTPSGELEAAIPYPATLRRSSQSHGD